MEELNNFSKKLKNEDIEFIVKKINSKNYIFFIGIGKSSNLSKQFSDQLKCIGIKSFFLENTNLLHGDIGCVTKDDLVILITKSGKSDELKNTIFAFKKYEIETLMISMKQSIYQEDINHNIIIPTVNENDPCNLIPTNSLICYQYFFNKIINNLIINNDIDFLRRNHPLGDIGKKILKIKDIMYNKFPKALITNNIDEIIEKITEFKIGMCCIIDKNDKFLGLITDGDIRRNYNNNSKKIEDLINYKPVFLKKNIDELIKNISFSKNHRYYPILNNINQVIGIIDTLKIIS